MPRVIRSLDGLAPLDARQAVVKYSTDNGKTWDYAKMDGLGKRSFSNGSTGYGVHRELSPHGTHIDSVLSDHDFAAGIQVKEATAAEIRGKKWSYERP